MHNYIMETDDAQIAANISPVIPRISGYVKEVRVTDNQHGEKRRYPADSG